MTNLPKINFREIREHETSQQRAFEELCYQLVPTIHSLGTSARLERRQAPDAGVEFSCAAPDGHGRWAWQAKYLFNLNAGTYRQMDRSATDAIAQMPDLRRYFFVLPTERTGRGNKPGESGLDRWAEHAETWTAAAAKSGQKTSFEFVGHSELLKALLDPKHAGAARYFFQKHFLESTWFAQQTHREASDLGRRYRPDVNVDLDLAEEIEALARSDTWREQVENARDHVRLYELRDPGLDDSVARAITQAHEATRSLLEQLVNDWPFLLDPTQSALADARRAATEAEKLLRACESTVRIALAELAPGDDTEETRNAGYRTEQQIWTVAGQVRQLSGLIAADEHSDGCAVLEGPAGCGKSHLLADVAIRRAERGAPTLLLLGQKFEMGDAWSQIGQMLGLDLGRDELLESLSVAAEVAGKGRCLLIIDALNEHVGVDLWPDRLAGFLADIARYPWIAAVMSIRSTYLEPIVGSISVERIRHPGLEGHEEEALERYAGHYGLRLADLPPLLPELSNPLFLGSLCRAIVARGLDAVPRDGIGASWVFDGLIADVEKSLSKRLDFAKGVHPVGEAVRGIAGALLDHDVDSVPWTEAQAICEAALPRGTRHSQSLIAGLVAEGLLLEESSITGVIIRFSYQRMGDHLAARELVRRAGTRRDVKSAIERLAELPHAWRLRGVVEALSVVVPEEMSIELMDVLRIAPEPLSRGDSGGRQHSRALIASEELIEHFVNGIPWRRSGSVTERTLAIAEASLAGGLIDRDSWTDLTIRLACVPGHPLNMVRTDRLLQAMSLPSRDREWSIYAVGIDDTPAAIDRVLQWAFNSGRSAPAEVRSLAALLLGWLLTSPDRRVRDRATKALVVVLDKYPIEIAALIDHFGRVNDPYVVERILAAGCGWALRHRRDTKHDLDAWEDLLVAAFDLVFAEVPPQHLMIRHYAREVIQRAVAVLEPTSRPIPRDVRRAQPPYQSPWPLIASSRRALEKAYGKEGEWNVINEWDDFFRYTISGALRDFIPEGQPRLRLLQRRKRARDLRRATDALNAALAGLRPDEAARVRSFVLTASEPDADIEAKSPEIARAWNEYLGARWRAERDEAEVRIEPDLVARFVSRRVLELGWSQARFGSVDRWLGQRRDRSSAPVERIGKKYAWIGLYEALGCIADHSVVRRPYGHFESVAYKGPWQVGYSPDIDPSHLVSDPSAARTLARRGDRKWWMPPRHVLHGRGDDAVWLRDLGDLPDLRPLLVRHDPRGGEWLALELHAQWRRPADRPKVGITEDRRELWVRTQSYLAHQQDESRVAAWAASRNWMGLDIPLPSAGHDAYLGSYPDLPPWPEAFAVHYAENDALPDGWVKTSGLAPRLQLTVAEYAFDRERDFSSEDATSSSAHPAPTLVELLGARWSPDAAPADLLDLGADERERAWLVGDEIVAFFTGPREDDEPSTVLVRAGSLQHALAELDLILWTWILGEKHYWSGGKPTRQRQEIYAAGKLSPSGWQEWGYTVDYVDHEANRRRSLIRRRR